MTARQSADLSSPKPPTEGARPTRLVYRLDDLPTALGVSKRTIARERSAGRFPTPDLHIGKAPLWRVETIHAWVAEGGAR